MKVAIISDIHANLDALDAVLADIEKKHAQKIFFLGDVVGYGAFPNECIAKVQEMCEIRLLGNHDYVALGLEQDTYFNTLARQSIKWTQQALTTNMIELLADFAMDGTYCDYYLVHATPADPPAWEYILHANDAEKNFGAFAQGFCFVGHSHLPAVFCQRGEGMVESHRPESFTPEKGCRYIINVGSVGQPRDGDSGASYVIADTDTNHFEFRRVTYDVKKAQAAMEKVNLPDFLVKRLAVGR